MESSAGLGVSSKLCVGDRVQIFYRASGVKSNGDARWMASPSVADSRSPHIGVTAGWHGATVVEEYDPSVAALSLGPTAAMESDGGDEEEEEGEPPHPLLRSAAHVQVRLDAARWINRTGERYVDRESGKTAPLRCAIDPRDVALADATLPPIALSLLVTRWAFDESAEVVGGHGGWGDTGAVVSDRYIENWMQTLHETLRGRFTVRTAWVASSADVARVGDAAGSLVRLLAPPAYPAAVAAATTAAPRLASFWFLWPVECQDGSLPAGYVYHKTLLGAMSSLEAAGVQTRFPHPSALYRIFLSKEWMATMCLSRGFRVPATTRVSVAAIVRDPAGAARAALASLHSLATAQLEWGMACASGPQRERLPAPSAMRGVAKLGFSWEASDVVRFNGECELAERLVELVEQPQMCASAVLVQQLVDDPVCEIRTFIVDGVIAKMLHTRFLPPDDDGRYAVFERTDTPASWFDRRDSATSAADGAAALAHAEATIAREVVPRWLQWLRAQHHEVLPVLRIDTFVVRRPGVPGECDVYSGELTELGASMIGWREGPAMVKPAVLRSCFTDGGGGASAEQDATIATLLQSCAGHAATAAADGVTRGMLDAAKRSVAEGQTAETYGDEFGT